MMHGISRDRQRCFAHGQVHTQAIAVCPMKENRSTISWARSKREGDVGTRLQDVEDIGYEEVAH